MKVKTRFAPSPTGNPHIGNIRTALYDFLIAKNNQGTFLLRIEDTDKKREIKDSHQAILDSLKWLGIKWDEGPFLQSERLEIYKEHAQQLVEKGLAYISDKAVYFKTDKEGETQWFDLIGHKKISFANKTQEDFVILKSDGYPTYHLASVVDDHLMEVTYVTRGEDWISSTPKHIMLYKAFGWELPLFGHFPNILASDKSKLAKRQGAVGVLDFKKDGFLPAALVNYLALLGWTPPLGKEVLSIDEMIEEFDIKDIHVSPAVFDLTKLEWMNGEYIRKMSDEELIKRLEEYLTYLSEGAVQPATEKLHLLVPLVKERIKKLSDFIPLTDFLFEKPEYEVEIFKSVIKEKSLNIRNLLESILKILESMKKPWTAGEFEKTFRKFATDYDISAGETFQLIRVAISGQKITPPLFETIEILGEEETEDRIKSSIALFS